MIRAAHQEFPELPIRQLCQAFEVSRSWYYARQVVADTQAQDLDLRDAIERILLELPGYGYRRVTHELARRG